MFLAFVTYRGILCVFSEIGCNPLVATYQHHPLPGYSVYLVIVVCRRECVARHRSSSSKCTLGPCVAGPPSASPVSCHVHLDGRGSIFETDRDNPLVLWIVGMMSVSDGAIMCDGTYGGRLMCLLLRRLSQYTSTNWIGAGCLFGNIVNFFDTFEFQSVWWCWIGQWSLWGFVSARVAHSSSLFPESTCSIARARSRAHVNWPIS